VVLVVSADSTIRAELREALTSKPGLRVIAATCVEDAVDLTCEIVVHLAVTDTAAAGLSRDLPWLPTIIVAAPDDIAPPVSGTAAQLLVRPLVPERLLAMVRLLAQR
jgi:DNA-binding response OmpR family regulator